MTRRLLVMMEALPGAGKTTLATGLVAHLRRLGHTVDHVPEEAIFNRTEFAEVGDAFKTKVFPTPELMLAAYRRIFTAALATGAHVVADWNALGMIEDLPSAQPDRTSVQRYVFKLTRRFWPDPSGQGRRVFRMAPLHHHFEMSGWHEMTVTVRFWLIAGILAFGGLAMFYTEFLSR